MKQIKLPVRNTFIESFSLRDVMSQDKVQMPDGKMGYKIATTEINPNNPDLLQARENGAQIIWATINVELKMQNLISKYLFGIELENNKRRNFFNNEIMAVDSINYAFQKKLSLRIIKLENLLTGKKYSELENKLKKIMIYRNAFAHGKLSIEKNKECRLEFYSSGPQVFQLDDNLWCDIESHFQIVNNLLGEAWKKL
ncbi:MAG: hypothetical protein GWP19_12020 [Planctomycetia bacterium]|nr:hypothetical protein [Planctomycetia bacterium]